VVKRQLGSNNQACSYINSNVRTCRQRQSNWLPAKHKFKQFYETFTFGGAHNGRLTIQFRIWWLHWRTGFSCDEPSSRTGSIDLNTNANEASKRWTENGSAIDARRMNPIRTAYHIPLWANQLWGWPITKTTEFFWRS
jgi:hypothetical protein